MKKLFTITVGGLLAAMSAGDVCKDGVCPPPAPVKTDVILPSGKLTTGANYWASHAATQMWRKWDAKVVDEDLRKLSENGMKLLRVFPNWADFQPIVSCNLAGEKWNQVYETRMFLSEQPRPDTPCGYAGVDEKMVEHFEEFCDIAEKYGMRLIVPLLTGQMTFRNLVPPALMNRDPYSDEYALMWEARYLECMVTRLKSKKAIVAWESGNEANILGNCKNRYQAEFWQRFIHQTIRLADSSRPVIGVHGLNISDEKSWPTSVNANLSDYVAVHPYGFWGAVYNDDFNTVRSLTFAPAQSYILENIAGRPAFIEEHGSRRQEQGSQENVAKYMRAMLWNAWEVDAKAMLWWCAYDQTDMTIAPYNWRQPCVELGIFKRDRSPYPAVKCVSDFAAMQESLPFKALPRARTEAVVITTDNDVAHSSYILARQAGIFPAFASPERKLPKSRHYFLPQASGRASLTIERWQELKARVRDGATLYLSLDDTFLDSMEEVCGIEIIRRERIGGTDVCDFGSFKVNVGYGVKRKFNALSAEVIAKNQNGDGVFFKNKYGKGTVYTFVHAIEKSMYQSAGKYEKGDAWKVWAMVRPVNRLLKTGEPNVFVSEHCFGGGRCGVVVINNRPEPYEGTPEMWKNWHVHRVITDDGANASFEDGKLKLAPCAGILIITGKDGVTDWNL